MAHEPTEAIAAVPRTTVHPMRLHFSPGACSRVTLIALEETRAEYTVNLVSLKDGDQRRPSFHALNPKGKVPVLETAEGILTENVAILSYLSRRYPNAHLLPAENDWEHAKALATLVWFASTIHPLLTLSRYPERFCELSAAPVRVRSLAVVQLLVQIQVAEDELAGRRWILGDRWSVADAYLYWSWGRCEETGVEPSRFPRVVDHHARMRTWPAVLRALERERSSAV
jgi:glutathione S-transferase